MVKNQRIGLLDSADPALTRLATGNQRLTRATNCSCERHVAVRYETRSRRLVPHAHCRRHRHLQRAQQLRRVLLPLRSLQQHPVDRWRRPLWVWGLRRRRRRLQRRKHARRRVDTSGAVSVREQHWHLRASEGEDTATSGAVSVREQHLCASEGEDMANALPCAVSSTIARLFAVPNQLHHEATEMHIRKQHVHQGVDVAVAGAVLERAGHASCVLELHYR
jgi:hypothetical protein